MNEEKYLSKLRNLMFTIQGQSLKQVLLREATKLAKVYESSEHSAEEIFHALSEKVYEKTNELTAEESFFIVSDADNLRQLKDNLFKCLTENFQWDETLAVLLEGLSENDRTLLKTLLENQHNYSKEAQAFRPNDSDVGLYKILIPIVRRVYVDMPIRDLVGFQPMSGPVGLAYNLQYKYDKESEEKESNDEANWPNILEGTQGRRMTLEVVSNTVEAASRKLQAGWTIGAQQDLSMHGLNIEAELAAALAQEIRAELTAEILADLRGLVDEPEIAKLKGSVTEQKNYIGIHINRAANEIARKTRRGAGNYIVISKIMADMLTTASVGIFKEEKSKSHGNYMLYKIGTLNKTIAVYVSPSMEYDEILVGYKSRSGSEVDTGYIHCPYVPLMSTGVVVNPKTFEPVISLMTRYGKSVFEAELTSSKDYYEMIKVESEFLNQLKELAENDKNDE